MRAYNNLAHGSNFESQEFSKPDKSIGTQKFAASFTNRYVSSFPSLRPLLRVNAVEEGVGVVPLKIDTDAVNRRCLVGGLAL